MNHRTNRALKSSRVKVAVRCRPAFQDEIDFAKGDFVSIVQTRAEALGGQAMRDLGQVSLATVTGKQRDFYFDYVFGEDASQDFVYDRLARPIVQEVLRGCNGTIFAYGQTGTGKTYTMGILDFVNNEHAGLIPRAIQQIFDYVEEQQQQQQEEEVEITIRLTEYVVRNYRESEALINLGLENRAIAPTLMNSTSSRSHTILTVHIEQKLPADPNNPQSYARTLRSKLLMVDLAGSERVRRTISQGTRLHEAKSINSSLSALGNVIAALASTTPGHVPYRDSKLTRLLQDSLGGHAATALIATIGPAAVNYGETLSTLLFAQRCMAVKISPQPQETVDYAELCTKLQVQLASIEGRLTEEMTQQAERYEARIHTLQEELVEKNEIIARYEEEREEVFAMGGGGGGLTSYVGSGGGVVGGAGGGGGDVDRLAQQLEVVVHYLHALPEEEAVAARLWFHRPEGWDLESFLRGQQQEEEGAAAGGGGGGGGGGEDSLVLPPPPPVPDLPANGQLLLMLGYAHELLQQLGLSLQGLLESNRRREEEEKALLAKQFEVEAQEEKFRLDERVAMANHDPQRLSTQLKYYGNLEGHSVRKETAIATSSVDGGGGGEGIGSHLAPLSKLEAMSRVEGSYRITKALVLKGNIHEYESIQDLCAAWTSLYSDLLQAFQALDTILERKDKHYQDLKKELMDQMMERRKREEEVVNWSYILKYLLASASKLRKQIKSQRQLQLQHRVAYEVLGIRDNQQAQQAMAIIDQLQALSPAQLQQLDPQTRQEILQMRRDLGLDGPTQQQSQSGYSERYSAAGNRSLGYGAGGGGGSGGGGGDDEDDDDDDNFSQLDFVQGRR
eukprot:gene8606-9484_t